MSVTVVIGAGPYGLAVVAALRRAGIPTRVFGEPMNFWRTSMPRGMLLRSNWDASHIGPPLGSLSLGAYEWAIGRSLATNIPVDDYVAYGSWYQEQVVPDLDGRKVLRIDLEGARSFSLRLDDGSTVTADRVVVAAGISPFASRPALFRDLPAELASHTSDHCDLATFARKRVIVIGGGQSALESAALLQEFGADVELVLRSQRLRFLGRSRWLHTHAGPLRELLYPRPDVGPVGLSLLVARPSVFRRLPLSMRVPIDRRCVRPAGAHWLRARLAAVRSTTGRRVTAVTRDATSVLLRLDDGSTREANHVLLATGYRVDIARYGFLSSDLLARIRRIGGYPVLGDGLESSVPGLHFVGAPAALSLGPVMRFVAGTEHASRAIRRAAEGSAPADRDSIHSSEAVVVRTR